MYTDSGTKLIDVLGRPAFMDVLVDNYYMDEGVAECPMSLITGVETGNCTFATAAALRSPKDGQTITRTWLVRDEWANGWDDPAGNKNGHGKRKFNFVWNDMNPLGERKISQSRQQPKKGQNNQLPGIAVTCKDTVVS
jgi:hypothetical protein